MFPFTHAINSSAAHSAISRTVLGGEHWCVSSGGSKPVCNRCDRQLLIRESTPTRALDTQLFLRSNIAVIGVKIGPRTWRRWLHSLVQLPPSIILERGIYPVVSRYRPALVQLPTSTILERGLYPVVSRDQPALMATTLR